MALCLPNSTARSSQENILWGTELFSYKEITGMCSKDQKGEHLSMGRIHSALHCAVGKSIRAPPNAACTWGAQHLKGCKIYLLSIFRFFFCLVKAVILLSHLLSGLFLLRFRRKLAPLSSPSTLAQNRGRHSTVQTSTAGGKALATWGGSRWLILHKPCRMVWQTGLLFPKISRVATKQELGGPT